MPTKKYPFQLEELSLMVMVIIIVDCVVDSLTVLQCCCFVWDNFLGK